MLYKNIVQALYINALVATGIENKISLGLKRLLLLKLSYNYLEIKMEIRYCYKLWKDTKIFQLEIKYIIS
jgi:hypothetical protein